MHAQMLDTTIIVILTQDAMLTWGLSWLADWEKLKFPAHYYNYSPNPLLSKDFVRLV